jgi:hypothetical protein
MGAAIGLRGDFDGAVLRRLARMTKSANQSRRLLSFAQLGNAQLDSASASLPVPAAVAIALHQAVWRLLAIRRSRRRADFHLHQPFGGKADHVAQNIRIRLRWCNDPPDHRLRLSAPQARGGPSCYWSSVIPRFKVGVCNPILTEIIDDHRNPAAPLQHSMKSARRGGLAAFSYTTSRDTTFRSTQKNGEPTGPAKVN